MFTGMSSGAGYMELAISKPWHSARGIEDATSRKNMAVPVAMSAIFASGATFRAG